MNKSILVSRFNPSGKFKFLFLKSSLALVVFAGFVGCGGDEDRINTDYSKLSLAPISDKALTPVSTEIFANYLKNGIRLRVSNSSQIALAEDATAGGGNSVEQSHFSTTNVHEIGVDEDDRLKFDGQYLYISEERYYPTSSANGEPAIRILRTEPQNAFAEEVARIEREDGLSTAGLYLHSEENQRSLVSIARSYQYYSSFLAESDWSWASGKTEVKINDVTNPANPTETWKIEIEGNLEGSRKIGNKIYILTRFIPEIEGIDYYPQNEGEKIITEKQILEASLSDLMPHYQTNDGAIRNLVSPDECLIAGDHQVDQGYADIISLTSIDISTRQIQNSVCLNANVQGIYSSPSNFYIGASGEVGWAQLFGAQVDTGTVIHKFALLDSGVDYQASGVVRGTLGWQDPSLRMSEYAGEFRIVTSEWAQNDFSHFLTILDDDGNGKLAEVGQLPNSQNPQPIGKPGEDIYAVRFVEDKAYVITFEQIDPLYQINLEDSSNPIITAELEMPGVARYLHPITNGWLFGIGHEVVDGLMQGVKVELYDIRQPESPRIVDSILLGERGSWSEVFNNLKAISVLPLDNNVWQIAMPITRYDDFGGNYPDWQDTALHVFEISGIESGEVNLAQNGILESETYNDLQYPLHWGSGRSLLHNEAIFYLQGNRLTGAKQGDFINIVGPF